MTRLRLLKGKKIAAALIKIRGVMAKKSLHKKEIKISILNTLTSYTRCVVVDLMSYNIIPIFRTSKRLRQKLCFCQQPNQPSRACETRQQQKNHHNKNFLRERKKGWERCH